MENAPSKAAQKLAELGLPPDPSIPYNLDSMFPKLTGWGANGEIKRKYSVIQNVEPTLKRVLMENEQVLYVAKGVQYKFSEHYFLGIWAALINQTVFVLTNLRLIMLNSDSVGKPKHNYWVIYYSQIAKFKGSWTGVLVLNLNDGLKLRFTGFKGTDRKQMPVIFELAMGTYRQLGFDPEVSQSRENLCTKCLQIVPKKQYTCNQCGQRYWKPGVLALRSLIFPSWGDFLMGHTGLAIMELLGYMISWVIAMAIILGEGGKVAETTIAVVIFGLFLAFEHATDAGLTYFIAKKGLTPRGKVQAPT